MPMHKELASRQAVAAGENVEHGQRLHGGQLVVGGAVAAEGRRTVGMPFNANALLRIVAR